MKTIKYLAISMSLAAFLFACSDDILEETQPPHFITADQLYTDLAGFESGLNGLHSMVRKEREGMGYSGGFGARYMRAAIFLYGNDNMMVGRGNRGEIHNILYAWGSANAPSSNHLTQIFVWLYEIVNGANTLIERAENPDVEWGVGGDLQKARILGEAHTIRAWAYRHLTYLYGDVPLMLEESKGTNIRTDLVREPVSVIRRQMIDDLKIGVQNIPWTPATPGSITKGVPLTYLAETYLAINKPDSALIWADAGIDGSAELGASPYRLITSRYGINANKPGTPFADMFHPANVNIANGNTEAMWVMQWERNVAGGGDNLMRFETMIRYDVENNVSWESMQIVYNDERGGRGWEHSAILHNTLHLYFTSSKNPEDTLETSNKVNIDQRGNRYIIGQYFVLGNEDIIPAGAMNAYYGRPWTVGDTIWIASTNKNNVSDWRLSGAVDWKKLQAFPDKGNWPYSLKFAYCDAGYPKATEVHHDQIYLRLAETILLRAEAKYRMGDLQGATNDINMLRDRANAARVSPADFGASLRDGIDFILDERTRELLLEEHRRNTLARMGGEEFMYRRIKQYNPRDGENFILRDTIFPIPQSVIDANLNVPMYNNPGYPGGK